MMNEAEGEIYCSMFATPRRAARFAAPRRAASEVLREEDRSTHVLDLDAQNN